MKMQQVEFEGIGQTMRVRMFMGDESSAETSRQWLETTVEVPVKGVMNIDTVQQAALSRLREVLAAEIAALPKGGQ